MNTFEVSSYLCNIIINLKHKIQKLEQENTSFKTIFDELPNSVYLKSKKGVYLLINNISKEQLINQHQIHTDIIGKTDYEIFPTESAKIYSQNDQEVLEQGKMIVREEEVILPNNQKCVQLSSKKPLRNRSGEITGLLGITIDITDKKEMEALITAKKAAEVASQAKSEFIQNMSHDLRTALTGLLSVAETHADTLPDHHEHKESFILMRDASRDLHQFCETVLEAASFDQPDELEAPTPFLIETLITHKVDLFKPAMMNKGLTCSVELLSDHVPPLSGHPLLIERILINLIGNAIKFTDVGSITLQYGLSEKPCDDGMTHQLTLIVKDTGHGIPAAKQAIIFDRFTRLTPSYQGLHKGQGLGLYITQKLLHQMGGTITVESEGVGTGTTFCCHIPVTLATQPIQDAIAPTDYPYRILIADDSKMARFAAAMLVKDVLKNATIEHAGTLSEIIQKTDHTAYDLLILDLAFPDGDAKTVVNHIQNTPDAKNVETPIVALTGRLDTAVYRDCLQAGMNTVIRKPLTLPMIQGFVDNLLT